MGAIGGQLSGEVKVIGVSTPTIDILPMPLAATEYSYIIPAEAKEFWIRNIGSAIIEYAYTSGGEAMPLFLQEAREKLNLNLASPLTIYFKSVKANQSVKIEYWS